MFITCHVSHVSDCVQESELPDINRKVGELQRRLFKGLGVRDTDKVLNDALQALKDEINDVRGKIDNTAASVIAGEGVASQADLQVCSVLAANSMTQPGYSSWAEHLLVSASICRLMLHACLAGVLACCCCTVVPAGI